jgi:hypothetical protein
MGLLHRQIAVMLFLFAAGLAGTAGAERATAQSQPKATLPKLGQFTIMGMDNIEGILERGISTWTLTGHPVTFTSARYDMTAPRIKATMGRNQVQSGVASGGARVVVRQPEEKRETTLTCSTATYRAAEKGKPARIDLAGPVKSMSKDPQVNPLDATFESGFIEFVDADTTRIVLEKPIISGTAIEKPPAPKKNP